MIETTSQFTKKQYSEAEKRAWAEQQGSVILGKNTFATEIFKRLTSYRIMKDVMLKGGFLLLHVVPNSRLTQDIDLAVLNLKDFNELVYCFKDIAEKDEDLSLEIRPPAGGRCGAIEIKSCSKDIVAKFDIELNYVPLKSNLKLIHGVTLETQPLEGVLVDKLSCLYGEHRFRRIKDLYDLYNILTNFDISYADFAYAEEKSGKTIFYSNTLITDANMLRFTEKWNSLPLRTSVNGNIFPLEKPDIVEVLKSNL